MDRLIATVATLLLVLVTPGLALSCAASTHSTHNSKHSSHTALSASAVTHRHRLASASHAGSATRNRKVHGSHNVIASSRVSSHRRRRHHATHQHLVAHHYAYPADMFLLKPPDFTSVSLPHELAHEVQGDFENGMAGLYPASALVQSGLISYLPLHGGIFWRRQPVKYLIMHSTETGVPRTALQVINGWNSLGRRHAGAQYVVDRDGQIYETVDPDLATVHVNIFKTLPGINNDNSIGIEMVHAGRQQYTHDQLKSVVRLVVYLLQRYQIDTSNLITHRYAQQGDHTDPVAFDWNSFVSQVGKLQKKATAKEMIAITEMVKEFGAPKLATPSASVPSAANKASGAAEAAVIPNNTSTSKSDLRNTIEVAPSAAKSLLQTK